MNITSEISYPTRKDCISSIIKGQSLLGRLVVIDNTKRNSNKCNLVCVDSKCLWRMKYVKKEAPHSIQQDASAFYPELSSCIMDHSTDCKSTLLCSGVIESVLPKMLSDKYLKALKGLPNNVRNVLPLRPGNFSFLS